MSAGKHTPGPWSVVDGHYPGFLEVVGASFKISIVTHATDLSVNQTVRRTSDAHLISAAPDLLNALMMVLDDPNALDGRPRTAEVVHEAIRKATGGQP